MTQQDGWLSTGDRGFVHQGELHVSGRIKETILINGCNYHAHDIEESVQAISGIRRGGIVAFGRPCAGSEQLVLIVECNSSAAKLTLKHTLRTTIRQRLGLNVADVIIVNRGTIARTTSGKLKRHALRQRYLAGEFSPIQAPSTDASAPVPPSLESPPLAPTVAFITQFRPPPILQTAARYEILE